MDERFVVWFSRTNNPGDDYADGGVEQHSKLDDAILYAEMNAHNGARLRKWIVEDDNGNVVATSENK